MLQNFAKKAAQEPPLEVQLSLCESFVSKGPERLVAHDQARELLAKELDEGERQLTRLRVAVTEKVPLPPAKDAESALRARLASVEEERDDQRPSRAFTGGLHAYVRRRNLQMDARSTSRFARCNVDRECHRSIEVVPRCGRCSHFVFEDSYSPVPLGQTFV